MADSLFEAGPMVQMILARRVGGDDGSAVEDVFERSFKKPSNDRVNVLRGFCAAGSLSG
jgi:hypothetical protein